MDSSGLLFVETRKESWEKQAAIKNDLKDCTVCGCPITNEDYEKYKMCPWCYGDFDLEYINIA